MRTLLILLLAATLTADEGSIDRRAQTLTIVRHALASALAHGRDIAFVYAQADATHPAAALATDDDSLSLRVDDATLRVRWCDVAARDLIALGAAVLPDSGETHVLLGRYAFDAGEVDVAEREFGLAAKAGVRQPGEAARLQDRRIEVAHAHREQMAQEAWAALQPLLDDPRRGDEALGALATFEAKFDDTRFILGVWPAIHAARARLRH